MSKSQIYKGCGKGKHANTNLLHTSIQFDKLLCESTNKPTAAKSAGTVGKWGMTSFTSIRSSTFSVGHPREGSKYSSLNKKRQAKNDDNEINAKRPSLNPEKIIQPPPPPVLTTGRKFFKSRTGSPFADKQRSTDKISKKSIKSARINEQNDRKLRSTNNVKDTKSPEKTIAPLKLSVSNKKVLGTKHVITLKEQEYEEEATSPVKERDKPPIVLRIFKGTSQLVNETSNKNEEDEEEKVKVKEEDVEEEKNGQVDVVENEPHLEPIIEEKIIIDENEPSITTRSLRRRSDQIKPKKTIKTTKTTKTEVSRSLRSNNKSNKLVISNLNSDNPTILSPEPITVKIPIKPTRHRKCKDTGANKKREGKEVPTGKTPKVNTTAREELIQLLEDDGPAEYQPEIPKLKLKLRSRENSDVTDIITVPEVISVETIPRLSFVKVEDTKMDVSSESSPKTVDSGIELTPASSSPRDSEYVMKKEAVKEESQDTVWQEDTDSANVTPMEISQEKNEEEITPVSKIEPIAETVVDTEPPVEESETKVEDSVESEMNVESVPEETNDAVPVPIVEKDDQVVEPEDKFELPTMSDECVTNKKPEISGPIKKSSFFKSREGNKKRLALYKHKWSDDKEMNKIEENPEKDNKKINAIVDSFEDEFEDTPLTRVLKPNVDNNRFDEDSPVTSVKCTKKDKEYYTVVRNVKKAHQIQESGEFQEFNDDVEYILDALQYNNPMGTRCLSAITLATKCMEPAFRMHVRAHGTVTKFFKTLQDATKDQSLGLCTATVMFVLSQDRLNMDIDKESLELMLNLLESDVSHNNALNDCGLSDSQLNKTRERVRQICSDIKDQGHLKHLNLDNITVGHLAMETLLSLTSKRAGEWFKEELRELGGLKHIIKTVVECCKHVDETANAWSPSSLEKIKKADRCLRVLENITLQNEQNKKYLLEYENGILIDTLLRMFKVCDYEIPLYPTENVADKESTGAILRECLIATLKVLINVTHDYNGKSFGSAIIGSKPGIIESSLHILLQVPQHIPPEGRFDLIILILIMLINLMEHCQQNRKLIFEAKAPSDVESVFETKLREPAVKALVSMFYHFEELARTEEKKTDALLDGENVEKPPEHAPQKVHEEFIEETLAALLQKAGQHMEHTLISSYVVLLVGYLVEENEEYIRDLLPEKNFKTMISVLQKFFSFMTLTASGGAVSNRGIKSTELVIKKLIESDKNHTEMIEECVKDDEPSSEADATPTSPSIITDTCPL